MPTRRALPDPLIALLLGAFLAACQLPLPWSGLAFLPLAAVLWFAAQAPTGRGVAGRLFWSGFGLFTVHLWWLTAFLAKLFGFAPLGVLAFALYALEGGFLAVMALLITRVLRTPAARVWGLAGGWVVLEWLRFLGPLAFPWPTLGYSLLPTPAIQIADLGGVLLGSVLVAFTAASLAWAALERERWGRAAPALALSGLAWMLSLGYGLTRVPGVGPVQPVKVFRVAFDPFGRATGSISAAQQFDEQLRQSRQRLPGEIIVWSETALTAPGRPPAIPEFPGPGISGVGSGDVKPAFNAVAAIDARGRVTSWNDKAKLVPFGEYFPLYAQLRPLYGVIERSINYVFPAMSPARVVRPLTLNGVSYGAYVCYDSVFPWVARALARQGAQLLVNPSNDGWYEGWGVQQHFNMGRVRAIETRRWLVRSVNEGVAGAVNDLGEPIQTVSSDDTLKTLSVRPRLLSSRTPYMRFGDLPALLLAALMVGLGLALDRRR